MSLRPITQQALLRRLALVRRLPRPLPPELADAEHLPWDDPSAAQRGRERYAAQQAAAARDRVG